MNPNQSFAHFEALVDHYREQLNGYSMEQLTYKPNEDEWSLGQMYIHLIGSSLFMHLRNVELCKDASDPAVAIGGKKTEDGEFVFRNGGFPPIRIKVPPSPQYTPAQPESKDAIYQGLNTVVEKRKAMEATLDGIPSSHTVAHPRLGALTAKEWFALLEMHYRHHLLQLERLQQQLASLA